MSGIPQRKTLAIETGILCNNRCIFCYQKGYRSIDGYPQMVGQPEILKKLEWGIANGYDELSLTGGEPTARPDFLDLVARARQMGYRRVAVTTNGWKLSRRRFFQESVEAGLTSMGVSVHGIDAHTHETLTGHGGSFRRAIQAIRNAVRTAGSYRPIRLNTFTLVNRLNHAGLSDLAEMLHGIGVRLMIFQPTILSKSNFEEAGNLALGLQDVVQAVREVVVGGMKKGFRTKLFNLPPCLFRDVLAGIDLDHYERRTFRENDETSPGSKSQGDEVGFVRLPVCGRCLFESACPGVHVTLLPQEDIVAQIEDAIASINPSERRNLWLAGTDLLRPSGLYRVVRKARLEGFTDLKVTFGGSTLGGLAGLRAAAEAGASELVLVHHPKDEHTADRILSHAGNGGFLQRAAEAIADLPSPASIGTGLLITPGQEALDFLHSPAITALGGYSPTLHLRASWRTSGKLKGALFSFREFLGKTRDLPFVPGEIVVEVPWPRLWELMTTLPFAALESLGRARFDLTAFVLQTSLLDPHYSVLNWSVPLIGGREVDLRLPVSRRFYSRAIVVQPIDLKVIQASQTPYGVSPGT